MDIPYKYDPNVQNQVLSLDKDDNLSDHLTYEHFKEITQDLKQDQFDNEYDNDLRVILKKTKIKKTRVTKPLSQLPLNMAHIDWNYLRTFYYVVKAGGFTEAEHYLRISQSSISRTVQKLERLLGQRLLVRRTARRTSTTMLTLMGEVIMAHLFQGPEGFKALNVYMQQKKNLTIS